MAVAPTEPNEASIAHGSYSGGLGDRLNAQSKMTVPRFSSAGSNKSDLPDEAFAYTRTWTSRCATGSGSDFLGENRR